MWYVPYWLAWIMIGCTFYTPLLAIIILYQMPSGERDDGAAEREGVAHGARSLGMILTDQFYVPMNMVKAVLDMSYGDAVEIGMPANAPSTETRQ